MDNFGATNMTAGDGPNNNFELLDCIADANFDQFIDLIRGRSEEEDDPAARFDDCDDLINSLLVDNVHAGPHFPASAMPQLPPDGAHYYADGFAGFEDFAAPPAAYGAVLGCFEVEGNIVNDVVGYEDNDDYGNNVDCGEEVSSGTTTTTAAGEGKRRKGDRSKTLISERRRRGSMKEKLYALRSLVPNITKMDKASIIGDAVSYLQDLQLRSKKLQAEVAGLEASLAQGSRFGGPNRKPIVSKNPPSITPKKILIQMDVYQVEERGYYVRLVCNKGETIAISLYKVIESLASFVNIQTTNLATSPSDKFILTFTLFEREVRHQHQKQQIDLPNLKMWVTNALLNQGFELLTV